MDSQKYVWKGKSSVTAGMAYLQHTAKEKLLRKMRIFCGYQPRSHSDLRQKLYSLGIWKRDVEEIIAQLIEEKYLNEQRYADKYIAGKKWGRTKIKNKLKIKFISERCISDAMKEIDEEKYKEIMFRFAREKWDSVKGIGANLFVKMKKTGNYLLQKGYESNSVWEALNKLKKGEI